MRSNFVISDQSISPGERVTISLPVPGQSNYTPLTMPIHVMHGKKDGPVLFVSAAIHGDELNGIEIIRRLLKIEDLENLRGTLICIPIVNVYGFFNNTRYLPDRRDLNRSFPGAMHGSLASRIAHVFSKEIVEKCTHGIDLHTGSNNRANLPHVRANLDDEGCEALAIAFGAPVAINANLRDGSLRQFAMELGVSMLLFEAGEALRFDELSISVGLEGILNVMNSLNMIQRESNLAADTPTVEARSSIWIRAPQSGIVRFLVSLGDRVEKKQPIGIIADALGEEETIVESQTIGIVIGRTNLPVVNEGDALFHIARFTDSEQVLSAIETFHEAHIEELSTDDYRDTIGRFD